VQKRAKTLHLQAQSLFDAEKFDEAYELWQTVILLAPKHEQARLGLAMVESNRENEQKRKQNVLKHQQKILLRLRRAGKLPAAEFDCAMSLIEKSHDELRGNDRAIREFLDDLVGGTISIENFLKSLKLLRESTLHEKRPSPAVSEKKAPGASIKAPPRRPVKEKLQNAFWAAIRIFIIVTLVTLCFSGLMIYAVSYFQQSNKIGVLSRYTIAVYFPQNDPDLSMAAQDIKSGLIKYGFQDRLILTQEVSDAVLNAVVRPQGNEIRYQTNEAKAATKLKSILAEIYLTGTFTAKVAQGTGKQTIIQIFLANTSTN
jgi:hypothetical protein